MFGCVLPVPADDGASVMSVCGSDMTHVHSLSPANFAGAASYIAPPPPPGAAAAAAAATPSPPPSSVEVGTSGGSEGSGPLETSPAEVDAKATPAGVHPAEAPSMPAADTAAAAAPAAAAIAGSSWSEQAVSAASRARAQLEACLPAEWSAWVQENPGTVVAGVGAVTAALAATALLFGKSGR